MVLFKDTTNYLELLYVRIIIRVQSVRPPPCLIDLSEPLCVSLNEQ